ncbi:hypothetical protein E2320_004355 [Naja naja]|nr:hypothetical protein E2320_004355 [Naja naja]
MPKQSQLSSYGGNPRAAAGDPPQAAAWIGQCFLYLLIVIFEKTAVGLVLLIPGWTKEILLDYIPSPQLELVLVILVVPFIVNVLLHPTLDFDSSRSNVDLLAPLP